MSLWKKRLPRVVHSPVTNFFQVVKFGAESGVDANELTMSRHQEVTLELLRGELTHLWSTLGVCDFLTFVAVACPLGRQMVDDRLRVRNSEELAERRYVVPRGRGTGG